MQKYEVTVRMPEVVEGETNRLILSIKRKLEELAATGKLQEATVHCVITVIGKDHAEKIPLVDL